MQKLFQNGKIQLYLNYTNFVSVCMLLNHRSLHNTKSLIIMLEGLIAVSGLWLTWAKHWNYREMIGTKPNCISCDLPSRAPQIIPCDLLSHLVLVSNRLASQVVSISLPLELLPPVILLPDPNPDDAPLWLRLKLEEKWLEPSRNPNFVSNK
jgi:hypothetical protein